MGTQGCAARGTPAEGSLSGAPNNNNMQRSSDQENPLSTRSKYKIIMAMFALTALVVAASSLTHEIHLVDNYEEVTAALDADAIMQKDWVLEDLDSDSASELLQPLVEPLEELVEVQEGENAAAWDEENPLQRLGSALTRLTAAQESLAKDDVTVTKKEAKERAHEKKATDASSAKKDAKVTKKAAKKAAA